MSAQDSQTLLSFDGLPAPDASQTVDEAVVESSLLTDSTGHSVHVRLSSSALHVSADGRSPLSFNTSDLIGCTSTQQSTTLALHLYPPSIPGCFPASGLQERSHLEVQLTAPDLPTASLWTIYLNRAARRLPLDKAPLPARSLLILINPASGTGDAPKKALVVTPIFEHSALPFNIQATTHAGHAYQIAHAMPLHTPTSIICISGDGLLYEVINGLLSRSDWTEAVRHVTLGVIAGGSGNGLAKTITYVSQEPNSLLSQAYLIIKGYHRRMDISTVIQAGRKPIYSFVSLAWALISDIDFLSERWRWCGDVRFSVAAVIRLIFPRLHTARLSFLPVGEREFEHKGEVEKHEGQTGNRRAMDINACGLHGQCPHCLKEGEEGEWEALQKYLVERKEGQGQVEVKDEKDRWKVVDAEFTMLWGLNIPWVTKDTLAAPAAHLSESPPRTITRPPHPSRCSSLITQPPVSSPLPPSPVCGQWVFGSVVRAPHRPHGRAVADAAVREGRPHRVEGGGVL